MRVRFARPARDHLREIRSWVAADDPAAAARLVGRLRRAAEMLGRLPEGGRPGRVPGTRELAVAGTRYLLVYRVDDQAVSILAVIHTARRWPADSRP